MLKLFRFIKYVKYKRICFAVLLYSFYYRILIKFVNINSQHKRWGEEGRESEPTDTREHYVYASKVAYAVEKICSRTPWESKCLVRALSAQKVLSNKGIHTTLYLGCKMLDGSMVAHAWLRCGGYYVTGGNGEEYTTVSKFYK